MSKFNLNSLLMSAKKIDSTLRYSSDYGVGKKMGSCIYLHVSSEDVLPQDKLESARSLLMADDITPENFIYQIVRYDVKDGDFAFIVSEDFDSVDEPTVGDSYLVKSTGDVSLSKKKDNHQIYHHKWQFVASKYDGFDVSESIARSILWKGIVGKDRGVSSRIGYSQYWNNEIVPKINSAIESGELKKIISLPGLPKI